MKQNPRFRMLVFGGILLILAAIILAATFRYFRPRQNAHSKSEKYLANEPGNYLAHPTEKTHKKPIEKKHAGSDKDQKPLKPGEEGHTREDQEDHEPVQSTVEEQVMPGEDPELSEQEESDMPEDPVRKKRTVSRDNWHEQTTDMEFIWVPGGSYEMGCWSDDCDNDEYPLHVVKVDGFWMGRYEVTVGQYMEFAKRTNSHYPPWMEEGNEYNIHTGSDAYYKYLGNALTSDNYPVVGISWNNATAFAEWLSRETGYTFRLPTEAEWEYACRSGGEKADYGTPTGSLSPELANYNPGEYVEDDYGWTAPVGSFPENLLSLYDMSGNVWEWCLDVYDINAYKTAEIIGENTVYTEGFSSVYETDLSDILAALRISDRSRVIRGGSWCNGPRDMRCSNRRSYSRSGGDFCVGFRVIMVPDF